MSNQFDTENILIKVINKSCTIPTQKHGSRIISFYNGDKEEILLPFQRRIIDTGYIISFSEDYVLMLLNEPSLSKFNGITILNRFQERSKNETLHITIHNITDTRIIIKPKQKIAEGVLTPVGSATVQVVKEIEF